MEKREWPIQVQTCPSLTTEPKQEAVGKEGQHANLGESYLGSVDSSTIETQPGWNGGTLLTA